MVQGQGRKPHPGPGDGHPDPINPPINQPALLSSTLQFCHFASLPACLRVSGAVLSLSDDLQS